MGMVGMVSAAAVDCIDFSLLALWLRVVDGAHKAFLGCAGGPHREAHTVPKVDVYPGEERLPYILVLYAPGHGLPIGAGRLSTLQ
jgi:hypothetical protein